MGHPRKKRFKRNNTLSHRKINTIIDRNFIIEAVLTQLSSGGGSCGVKRLFRQLGFPQRIYPEYLQIIHELLENGQIEQRSKRRLFLPKKEKIIRGTLRLTTHGYGFIDQPGKSSVFINAREARRALDGDLVTVAVHDKGHPEGPEGVILEVDAERRAPLLGQLQLLDGEWYADIQSGPLTFRAKIGKHGSNFPYRSGDWALVNVPGIRRRYPLPTCRVIKLFGNPKEKGIVEKGLIASFGLQESYPEQALKQALKLKAAPTPRNLRHYLRNEKVITIDPEDAKDHDDAVSLRQDKNGHFLLGVHIADVSRYVPEESPIDIEAKQRGFSVYLQNHHLPMLPPKLPGEICSLKPGRDRLALSVQLRIDQSGQVLERNIIPSQIRIWKLISYATAQKALDSNNSNHADSIELKQLRSELLRMRRLSRILKKKRLSEGGVDFDLPEAGFSWDERGSPSRIFRQPRLESHELIEEFMLAANRAVAEIWAEKFGNNAPNVFRVHPPPEAEKRQKLSDYLADAGMEWSPEHLSTAKQLTQMLDEVRRRFPIEITSVAARKALTLARYHAQCSGHFGLGFKRYLHFTSPIRRYADLTVHRLLWKYIINGHNIQNADNIGESLQRLCDHLTAREQVVAEVEREANKAAGLLYLNERQDQDFPARLVEVAREKMYVSLENLYIEGALDLASNVRFTSRRKSSVKWKQRDAHRTGLSIGDSLSVRISSIDLLRRKLELQPV